MCVFCDIIQKKSDAIIVHETEKSIAFLDIEPINEGHVLIVPKCHASMISDIPLEVLIDIFEVVRKIVDIYDTEFGAKGYSIMQNGGEFCDFGHFHVHVFPRYKEDGFGWTYPQGSFEYSEEIADKIRKAF